MALEVFRSLYDAKLKGFEPYDRSPIVFLVRRKIDHAPGWELAAVQLSAQPDPKQ